jgi:hypothetical protein
MFASAIRAGRASSREAITWTWVQATARLQAWQAALDDMLVPAEAEGEKKSNTTLIIGIVVAVVVVLCLLPMCVILILALLGPAVGNVFSNIVEGI